MHDEGYSEPDGYTALRFAFHMNQFFLLFFILPFLEMSSMSVTDSNAGRSDGFQLLPPATKFPWLVRPTIMVSQQQDLYSPLINVKINSCAFIVEKFCLLMVSTSVNPPVRLIRKLALLPDFRGVARRLMTRSCIHTRPLTMTPKRASIGLQPPPKSQRLSQELDWFMA